MILRDWGNTYKKNMERIAPVLDEIEEKYKNRKKGIFLSNDTLANVFLNLLVRKYGTLPGDYQIVGFDGSPISSEAIIPISTVGQQIDKIAYQAMELLVMQMNEKKSEI